MNLNNKKIKILFINAIVFSLLFSSVIAYAATGDFKMNRRVVNGYQQNTYTYSSKRTKTVSCSAKYIYSDAPADYDTIAKNNKLGIAVYKKTTTWFGLTKWTEEKAYQCSYSNNNFSLNKSITLDSGTYGFMVYRGHDDIYLKKGKTVGYVTIKGNVKFK